MPINILGAVALTGGEFAESQAELVLGDVACNGLELSLLNCSHSEEIRTDCGSREDAGLVCQRMCFAIKYCNFCVCASMKYINNLCSILNTSWEL